MDVLTAWAMANPAMARLLWVLVLMLVTLLLWICFWCYSWNQSSSPSLEKYLAGMWGPGSSCLQVCGGSFMPNGTSALSLL